MAFTNITQQLATRAEDVLCIDDFLPSFDHSREIQENAACPASMQLLAPLVMAVSDNSDNQLAANIMNRLESAEAPVMKSSQVVKEKVHTISGAQQTVVGCTGEGVRASQAPCSSQCQPRSATSRSVQDFNTSSGDVFSHSSRICDTFQIQVHDERIAALEEVQQTAQVPALAHRVLAVEISLASLNPSANIEMQTSWLSSVPARLESLESSIAAISIMGLQRAS